MGFGYNPFMFTFDRIQPRVDPAERKPMRYLKTLRDMRLRTKLLVAYLGLVVLLFTSGGIGAFYLIERTIRHHIENDLRHATGAIISMVETTALGSIKNYLRAVAESNLEMAASIHRRFRQGRLTEAEAREEIRSLLLSQTIGKTGYIYCVDSRGVAAVHPNADVEGNNWLQFDFVRLQTRKKTGYIEYQWQNPGEPTARPKALYMTYFAPFDWIISVSTYRDEFRELLPMDEIRQSVRELRFGPSGYAFVADRQGNAIIHPEMQGQNILETADVDTGFFETMLAKEFGRVTYLWRNPAEPEPREKIMLFGYIPELQWLVGSTGYMDEVYAPLKRSRNRIIAFIAGAVGLSLVLTLVVSHTITRRLEHLMAVIAQGDRGDLTVRAAPGDNDEIGRLGRIFNSFMERLQIYHGQLAAEIEEHRATADSLQHERDFNAMVLSTAEALVLVLDGSGRIVSFNRACAQCSGYAPEEVKNRFLWDDLIPEDEIESVKAAFAHLDVNKRHDDDAIQRAQDWMHRNVTKDFRFEELAATVGMSPRNFIRRFKSATGITPLAYLQKLRIATAKRLLETGRNPIQDVSSQVGYDDLIFFRNLFKRHTGLSPGDYRRRFGSRAAPQST